MPLGMKCPHRWRAALQKPWASFGRQLAGIMEAHDRGNSGRTGVRLSVVGAGGVGSMAEEASRDVALCHRAVFPGADRTEAVVAQDEHLTVGRRDRAEEEGVLGQRIDVRLRPGLAVDVQHGVEDTTLSPATPTTRLGAGPGTCGWGPGVARQRPLLSC